MPRRLKGLSFSSNASAFSGRIGTAADPFFATQPENMLALLFHLRGTYGSIPAWLAACGVSDETARALRSRLLECR